VRFHLHYLLYRYLKATQARRLLTHIQVWLPTQTFQSDPFPPDVGAYACPYPSRKLVSARLPCGNQDIYLEYETTAGPAFFKCRVVGCYPRRHPEEQKTESPVLRELETGVVQTWRVLQGSDISDVRCMYLTCSSIKS
jgi:hypothetical protein